MWKVHMYKCYFYWLINKEATAFLPASPPSPFPHKPSVPTSQYTPPLLFRKGQVCHEYQQNMKYQVAVTIRTSPVIKTEQGNLVWAIRFQKSGKESDSPWSCCYEFHRRIKLQHSYIYLECLGKSHTSSLVVSSVSCKSRLIDYVGFLMVSLNPVTPTIFSLLHLQYCSRSI